MTTPTKRGIRPITPWWRFVMGVVGCIVWADAAIALLGELEVAPPTEPLLPLAVAGASVAHWALGIALVSLAPVVYAPMRPPPSTDAEARLPLTKPDEWEHEDEWRIVDMNLRRCADAIDLRRAHWQCAIRPASVQQVIIGCRAAAASRDSIAAVLEHEDFQHVSLLRAEADEQRFCLNFHEQPREARGT